VRGDDTVTGSFRVQIKSFSLLLRLMELKRQAKACTLSSELKLIHYQVSGFVAPPTLNMVR